MHQGLHVTSSFNVIKNWIELRRGIPAAVAVDDKLIPAIAFGDVDELNWFAVSIDVFFNLMVESDLVFAFEDGREDDPTAQYFQFLAWEKYTEEVPELRTCECGNVIAQNCFS